MATKVEYNLEINTGRAVKNLAQVSRHAEQVQRGLGGVSGAARGVASSLLSWGAGLAGVVSVTAAIKEFARAGIEARAAMETLQASYGVLLKSTVLAADATDRLAETAARTPYQLEVLGNAFQRLIAGGLTYNEVIDETSGILWRIGDLALGSSEKLVSISDAVAKMASSGKVTLEQLMRIAEQGIPIVGALAERFGVTNREVMRLISEGRVGLNDVLGAIRDLTRETGRFADGARVLADTWDGVWSTFRDNVGLLSGALFAPLLDGIKQAVSGLNDLMATWRKAISEADKVKALRAGEIVAVDDETLEKIRGNVEQARANLDAVQNYQRTLGLYLREVERYADAGAYDAMEARVRQIAELVGVEWVEGVTHAAGVIAVAERELERAAKQARETEEYLAEWEPVLQRAEEEARRVREETEKQAKATEEAVKLREEQERAAFLGDVEGRLQAVDRLVEAYRELGGEMDKQAAIQQVIVSALGRAAELGDEQVAEVIRLAKQYGVVLSRAEELRGETGETVDAWLDGVQAAYDHLMTVLDVYEAMGVEVDRQAEAWRLVEGYIRDAVARGDEYVQALEGFAGSVGAVPVGEEAEEAGPGVTAAHGIQAYVDEVVNAALGLFDTLAMAFAAGNIGNVLSLVTEAFATLGPAAFAIAVAFETLSGVFDVVGPVLMAGVNVFASAINMIGEVVGTILLPIFQVLSGHLAVLAQVIGKVFEALSPVFQIIAMVVSVFATLIQILNPVTQLLAALGVVVSILNPVFEGLRWVFENVLLPPIVAVAAMFKFVADVIGWFAHVVKEVADWIGSFFTDPIRIESFPSYSKIYDDMMNSIKDSGQATADAITAMVGQIETAVSSEVAGLEGVASSVGASYTAARPVEVYVTVNTSALVGEQGIREFALLIREQIELAESLGY